MSTGLLVIVLVMVAVYLAAGIFRYIRQAIQSPANDRTRSGRKR